jgi:hypothetical protein
MSASGFSAKSVMRLFRSVVPKQAIGMIDYLRFPERRDAFGGPFNGQPARQALFREIVTKLRPRAIIDTGTFLGATTEFMAQTCLPVFSIELDRRTYGFARARLWSKQNVTLLNVDSRTALRKLSDGVVTELPRGPLFFYLDAHWNIDLPLLQEIDLIYSRWRLAIVMIDDFRVPADPGYGYDDYGSGKSLELSYIAPAVSKHQLRVFYPSRPSTEEGGARRGCVVLAKKRVLELDLGSMTQLREIGYAEHVSL